MLEHFNIVCTYVCRLGKSYFISFYYSLRSRLNTQADLQKVFVVIIMESIMKVLRICLNKKI